MFTFIKNLFSPTPVEESVVIETDVVKTPKVKTTKVKTTKIKVKKPKKDQVAELVPAAPKRRGRPPKVK